MKRALLCLILCGCDAIDPATTSNDPPIYSNQQVSGLTFEIVQKPDATIAGWARFSDSSSSVLGSSESCTVEALDARTVPQGVTGTATFSGGKLASSLTIVGGQDMPRAAAGAWTTGDMLTFTSQGFEAPVVGPLQLDVPSTSLKVLTDDGALTIPSNADFVAHWAPGTQSKEDSVLVRFLSSTNVELRCLYSRDAIWGPVPSDLLAKLGSKTGTLSFATRRVEVRGNESWIVYVVATAVIREQAYTLVN